MVLGDNQFNTSALQEELVIGPSKIMSVLGNYVGLLVQLLCFDFQSSYLNKISA